LFDVCPAQKVTKLLEQPSNENSLNRWRDSPGPFQLLSSDGQTEDVLAYCLIFYIVFTRLTSGYHLIKTLILVLMRMQFLVDWVLAINENVLDRKLGFASCAFAKVLKSLAKAIHDQHDSQILTNYDALLHLLGIDDRATMLYLNYSAEKDLR